MSEGGDSEQVRHLRGESALQATGRTGEYRWQRGAGPTSRAGGRSIILGESASTQNTTVDPLSWPHGMRRLPQNQAEEMG